MVEERRYPTLKFKVLKNLYKEVLGGKFIRTDFDGAEVWSKKTFKWTTEKHIENSGIVLAGKILAFNSYYYNIINVSSDEEKKEAIVMTINVYDNIAGKIIDTVKFYPFELNILIKQDAIEII